MSYEEEKKELAEWVWSRLEKTNRLGDRERVVWGWGMLDGGFVPIIHKQDTHEYNWRLLSLKEKYGRISEGEAESLKGYRARRKYDEEMLALCTWLEERLSERLDEFEKAGGVGGQFYPPEYTEFERRWDALKEKHGVK